MRRGRAEIEAELNWIEHLATCGICVPRLIPDNEGNKIISMSYGDEYHVKPRVYEALILSIEVAFDTILFP